MFGHARRVGPVRAAMRMVREFRTVRRMGGWRCLFAYLTHFSLTVPAILRERTLAPVDRRMDIRAWRLRACNQWSVSLVPAKGWPGGSQFGLARELYGRCVYFGGPHFTITPEDIVIDLGANAGVFTVLAATAGARVVAVEANPSFIRQIAANVGANQCQEQVTIISGVLGSTGLLFDQPGAEASEELVPTVDLQNVFSEHDIGNVDFMKIDIEGTEFEILRGPPAWIHRVRQIAMEVHVDYGDPDELERSLRQTGMSVRRAVREEAPSNFFLYAWRPKASA